MNTFKFKIGDIVRDKDGFEGTIIEIYDVNTYVVQLKRDSVIRFGSELTLISLTA